MDLNNKKAMIIARDVNENTFRQKENAELIKSSGAKVVSIMTQNLDKINPRYYFGSGKIKYFSNVANELKVDFVVVCEDLSPAQLKNIKDEFDMLVIDRNQLILELFNQRATTSFGKLQVELATLLYMYPRLRGARQDMDRQFGVLGMRGAGEQKLELDRRVIRRRIDKLRADIREAQIVEDTKSKRRKESSIPIVSLIGYSNTGKSTLLNNIIDISGRDKDLKVYADDRLFATLDTHARKITLPEGNEIIITDTVGLISELPHQLIDAFNSTLSEIKYSDLLLQVIDISNENLEVEIDTTNELIEELGLGDKDIIKVYNKSDKVKNQHVYRDADLVISAYNDKDVFKVLKLIEKKLFGVCHIEKKLFTYDMGRELSDFLDRENIVCQEYKEEGTLVTYKCYEKW